MKVCFYHSGEIKPYIRVMVASVKSRTDLALVQFTDDETDAVNGVDEIVRTSYGCTNSWMLSKIRHLADYGQDNLIVLDTDCKVIGDLVEGFEKDFDVAMYERPGHRSEDSFNGGVIYARNRDFWKACEAEILKMPEHFHRWNGDQLAENRVIRHFRYHRLHQRFNYTPQTPTKAKCPPADTVILHFKGGRKDWMH